ncbi:MAG: UDP-glucose dehydrogenase family protein [Nevskiales bacterium]
MNVTVFGSGYVGLVTAACLANDGNHVVCVDVDVRKVQALQQGQVPIFEPGLEELVRNNSKAGRLRFTTDAGAGALHGGIIFIAVGTPPSEDGSADLRHVLDVAGAIGRHMDGYRVIVTKSTVPVGSADKVREAVTAALHERSADIEFDVASNPEFLKEGAAVHDFQRPDRIVIGAESPRALEQLQALYAPFIRKNDRILVMDTRSAELTKYAANAMLATKISFMNELANLADQLGADIEAVRKGIGADARIGYQFIYPGVGYGGSCFPKDIQALINMGKTAHSKLDLIEAVEAVNERQKHYQLRQIERRFGKDLKGKIFAIWGLAFKPETDDMREASSRTLLEGLWQRGAGVRVFDPEAMDEMRRQYGERADLVYCASPEEAATGADALVLVTEWHVFRNPDFAELRKKLRQPVIFDGRNIYEPKRLRELGFEYFAVGRPS